MLIQKWNLILFLSVVIMIASIIWFLSEFAELKIIVKGQSSDNANLILSIMASIISIIASIIAIKQSIKRK